MMELPEALTIARQVNGAVVGKRIRRVLPPMHRKIISCLAQNCAIREIWLYVSVLFSVFPVCAFMISVYRTPKTLKRKAKKCCPKREGVVYL